MKNWKEPRVEEQTVAATEVWENCEFYSGNGTCRDWCNDGNSGYPTCPYRDNKTGYCKRSSSGTIGGTDLTSGN